MKTFVTLVLALMAVAHSSQLIVYDTLDARIDNVQIHNDSVRQTFEDTTQFTKVNTIKTTFKRAFLDTTYTTDVVTRVKLVEVNMPEYKCKHVYDTLVGFSYGTGQVIRTPQLKQHCEYVDNIIHNPVKYKIEVQDTIIDSVYIYETRINFTQNKPKIDISTSPSQIYTQYHSDGHKEFQASYTITGNATAMRYVSDDLTYLCSTVKQILYSEDYSVVTCSNKKFIIANYSVKECKRGVCIDSGYSYTAAQKAVSDAFSLAYDLY